MTRCPRPHHSRHHPYRRHPHRARAPLLTPALLDEKLPVPEAAEQLVETSRAAISRILHGHDDRLLVIVGPCSIHDHDQAMEYARLLKAEADAHAADLLIVMRVYFEKPRTTVAGRVTSTTRTSTAALPSTRAGDGPTPAARCARCGLPVGTEFLDLLSPQFISDLVTWGAIGAVPRRARAIVSSPVGCRVRSVSRMAPTAA